MFPVVTISPTYADEYPEVSFGLTLISNCQNFLNPPGFDIYKRKLLRNMRRSERLSEVSQRIEMYKEFFQRFGSESPLTNHLKRTINSGFPRYNLMVDVHFMSEMFSGILVAVTDYDTFEGDLTLDLAKEGEICIGMGNRNLCAKEKEIVLRDEREIVCILCQGADEKTRVTENTKNVLFYAYAIPGINAEHLEEGLTIAANTMKEFGGGNVEGLSLLNK